MSKNQYQKQLAAFIKNGHFLPKFYPLDSGWKEIPALKKACDNAFQKGAYSDTAVSTHRFLEENISLFIRMHNVCYKLNLVSACTMWEINQNTIAIAIQSFSQHSGIMQSYLLQNIQDNDVLLKHSLSKINDYHAVQNHDQSYIYSWCQMYFGLAHTLLASPAMFTNDEQTILRNIRHLSHFFLYILDTMNSAAYFAWAIGNRTSFKEKWEFPAIVSEEFQKFLSDSTISTKRHAMLDQISQRNAESIVDEMRAFTMMHQKVTPQITKTLDKAFYNISQIRFSHLNIAGDDATQEEYHALKLFDILFKPIAAHLRLRPSFFIHYFSDHFIPTVKGLKGFTHPIDDFYIYLAGKDKISIATTLTHEATHASMNILYGSANPYFINSTRQNIFKETVTNKIQKKYEAECICNQKDAICTTLENTFDNPGYSPAQWDEELIARYFELVARGENQTRIDEYFPGMKNYFLEYIFKDIAVYNPPASCFVWEADRADKTEL